MWIIPKNLNIYHYAQDMGGLILDSQELSDQLEQSVLWRSKPSQSKTWSLRLKRDSSIKHLFSQTLKPSIGNSFMEKWTSSVEASLVSHLAQQEEEKEAKIQDTCGHISQMESNDWEDLPLFSSRMLKGLSQVNSREAIGEIEKELQSCFMSSENWNDWVIKQRQEYSQRVKLERHTKEKESLYLVSEMISHKQVLIMSTDSSSLINQTESQHGQLQEDNANIAMNRQELRWATPNTMDHLTPKSQETLMRQATTVRKGRKAPSNLREQVDPVAMEVYKQANWATPMAGTKNHMGSSIEYYTRRQNVGKQVDLNGQVMLQNWATPQARDHKGAQGRSKKGILDLPAQTKTKKKTLNPRWVEMLMGLPIGWTMPSCLNPVIIEQMNSDCLETE